MTALCAALLTVATGCGQPDTAIPQASSQCDDVTFPPPQTGSHLLGDTDPPVPYSSTPPTSGWHGSGPPPQGVFDEPLSEPAQVNTLEAGGVVVTHNGLADADRSRLETVLETPVADRIAMTPYDAIGPGEVVFASWGAMQRCDGVDVAALEAYVQAYGAPITPHR